MRRRSLAIDANVLLGVVVALVDPILLASFKRTRGLFSDADREMLVALIDRSHVVVTPHVLTEVANLLDSLREPRRSEAIVVMLRLCEGATERWKRITELHRDNAPIERLGLTDAALYDLATRRIPVVTADRELSDMIAAMGRRAVTIDELRSA